MATNTTMKNGFPVHWDKQVGGKNKVEESLFLAFDYFGILNIKV